MSKDELISIAEKWIKAWNDLDHGTLVSMMKENSTFATMASGLDPIFIHEQSLIPNLYVSEWFHRKLEITKQLNLKFTIFEIKTGDGFVQVKSKLSNGYYAVDFLRIDKEGKIDQLIRNIDNLYWVGEIV